MTLYNLAWAVVLLPLGAAAASYVVESTRRAATVCLAGTVLALVAAVIVLVFRLAHISQAPHQATITFWVYSPGAQTAQVDITEFNPQLGIIVDGLSATLLPAVLTVSLAVQLYALRFLRNDAGLRRFFVVVAVMTFAVLGVVASPDIFQTYIMWEVAGVGTYILVVHWWHRPEASAAGLRMLVVDRIGGLALLLVVVMVFIKLAPDVAAQPNVRVGSNDPFNFPILGVEWTRVAQGLVLGATPRTLEIIGALTLLAVAARCAQLPLTLWLPRAAEAPTPSIAFVVVAAAATGGATLLRNDTLLLAAPHLITATALLGAVTAVYAAAAAVAQTDIKRLLAYLVASQLGLVLLGFGSGATAAATLTLLAVLWTMPLLLLVAGNVISAYGTQDIRLMGGVRRRMPRTAALALVGCAAAAGLVPLSGFWARDGVLSGVMRNQPANGLHLGRAVQVVLLLAAGAAILLGALACFRLYFTAFCGDAVRRRGFVPDRVREAPGALLGPAAGLAVLAVVGGLIGIEGARYTLSRFVYSGAAAPPQDVRWWAAAMAVALPVVGLALSWATHLRRIGAFGRAVAALGGARGAIGDGLRLDAGVTWAVARGVGLAAPAVRRIDDELVEQLGDGLGEAVAALGVETEPLRHGTPALRYLGAATAALLIVGLVTLGASGHLPGVGGWR